MKQGDVFNFNGEQYKLQSVETEWVRATKIKNGAPQRGRPAKLPRKEVELVFNPLLASTSSVSTPTDTTVTADTNVSAPTPKVKTPEEVEKDKEWIKNQLSELMQANGGVNFNDDEEEDEASTQVESEDSEPSREDLATLFEE